MKVKALFIIVIANFFFFATNAQVKIYPGGNTYIGSTAATGPGVKLQVVGNSVFSSTTSTFTSAPFLRGMNTFSQANQPDFAWINNSGIANIGLFHPSANVIGFSINGTEKFRINSLGKLLNGNNSSAANSPDYSWKNDSTTGIYHPSANIIAFSTAGAERFKIIGNGQCLAVNNSFSASTPEYSFNSEANTGMYRAASASLAFSVGGSEKMRIGAGAIQVNTTSLTNGKLNIASSNGTRALWCEYTTNADWQQSIVTKIDRANSSNYVVNLGGTDNFYVAGAGWIYSQGLYLGSDINLKSNVNTISGALQKIQAIRGVIYNLKTETSNPSLYGLTAPNPYMGVIAQEVELVAPELVRTMPNGTKAVAYQNMIGLLIEAIKEQSVQITELKQDLASCCSIKTQSNRFISDVTIENIDEAKAGNIPYLGQNKPNPFSLSTKINCYIPAEVASASILVFDMNGKLLKTYEIGAIGENTIVIDSKALLAGMYLYSLLVDGKEVASKRMILTAN